MLCVVSCPPRKALANSQVAPERLNGPVVVRRCGPQCAGTLTAASRHQKAVTLAESPVQKQHVGSFARHSRNRRLSYSFQLRSKGAVEGVVGLLSLPGGSGAANPERSIPPHPKASIGFGNAPPNRVCGALQSLLNYMQMNNQNNPACPKLVIFIATYTNR